MSRKRRRPVRCPRCQATARWRDELGDVSDIASYPYGTLEGGYVCERGDWFVRESEVDWRALDVEDGRIRSPADVAPRVEGARQQAATDGRLSTSCRQQLGLYVNVALEHSSVEIAAADEWAAKELGIDRRQVGRNRRRLEGIGYTRRLRLEDVTR